MDTKCEASWCHVHRRNLIRAYSRVVGVAFALLGLAGLVNLVQWAPPVNIAHLFIGITFAWCGFLVRDTETVRMAVGGIGALLVLSKALIMAPLLLGRAYFHLPIEVTCLVIGLLSVLAARYLRDGESNQR